MLRKLINLITGNLKYIIIIYVSIQLIYVIFFPSEFRSDAAYYFKLAQECIQSNSFYPAPQHLYEDYIFAPLFINLLVIVLNIYNSALSIGILNIILNMLQLLLLYKLTENIFNKSVATLSAVLYIFYLNNLGLVLTNYTELLFGVLILGSLFFYIKKTNKNYFISGFLLGASITVRPVGWTLFAAFIIFFLYNKIKSNNSYPIIIHLTGVVIFILLFGSFNYLHFGRFVFTSTTGPVNLLLGANDDATGGFKSEVYKKGKAGYIENPDTMTYYEKDDFYLDKASHWIISHPLKWLWLMPMKLIHTFIWDDIALSNLLHTGKWDFARAIKYIVKDKSIKNILPGSSRFKKAIFFTVEGGHLIYYYLLLVFIILGTFNYFKSKSKDEIISIILLYVILGIAMILITVGNPRYKYPFITIMIPFAAYFIRMKLSQKEVSRVEQVDSKE